MHAKCKCIVELLRAQVGFMQVRIRLSGTTDKGVGNRSSKHLMQPNQNRKGMKKRLQYASANESALIT